MYKYIEIGIGTKCELRHCKYVSRGSFQVIVVLDHFLFTSPYAMLSNKSGHMVVIVLL